MQNEDKPHFNITNEDSRLLRETINQVVCSNQAKGEVSKHLNK